MLGSTVRLRGGIPRGGTLRLRGGIPRGGTLRLRGGTLRLRGSTLRLRGGTIRLRGGTLHLRGSTLRLRGGTIRLRSGTLRIRGGTPGACSVVAITAFSGRHSCSPCATLAKRFLRGIGFFLESCNKLPRYMTQRSVHVINNNKFILNCNHNVLNITD